MCYPWISALPSTDVFPGPKGKARPAPCIPGFAQVQTEPRPLVGGQERAPSLQVPLPLQGSLLSHSTSRRWRSRLGLWPPKWRNRFQFGDPWKVASFYRQLGRELRRTFTCGRHRRPRCSASRADCCRAQGPARHLLPTLLFIPQLSAERARSVTHSDAPSPVAEGRSTTCLLLVLGPSLRLWVDAESLL